MSVNGIIGLFKQLATGVPVTLSFIVVAWILGFLLATLVTAGRLSRHKWLRYLLNVYVSFVRSVPVVLQLFIVYYGVPLLVLTVTGIDMTAVNKMVFCVIAFVGYYGAYLSEILRPAYRSISVDQHEAAYASGYTKWQTNVHVVIPQMLSVALPGLGNEVINLVHQSSLLFVLGTVDLMGQADTIVSTDYTASPVLTYFCAGVIYWVITVILTTIVHAVERRTDRYKIGDTREGRLSWIRVF